MKKRKSKQFQVHSGLWKHVYPQAFLQLQPSPDLPLSFICPAKHTHAECTKHWQQQQQSLQSAGSLGNINVSRQQTENQGKLKEVMMKATSDSLSD